MKLSTNSRGQLAQLHIELAAYNKGFFTSKPQTDLEYDLIIDQGDKLIRCQIKYCNRKRHNSYNLELRLDNKGSNRLHYDRQNVDLLLVYIPSKDAVLSYGANIFHKKQRIEINLTNKNSKWFWEKFVW